MHQLKFDKMANRRGKKEIKDKIIELNTKITVLTEAKEHVRNNEDFDRIAVEIRENEVAVQFLNWVLYA